MRRLTAVVAIMATLGVAGAWAGSRDVLSYAVVCTATVSHLAVSNVNRQDLTVQNVGTLHVNVGRRNPNLPVAHAGGFSGLTLHVGSSLELRDYQGGLECGTQPGTGGTLVEVLEQIK